MTAQVMWIDARVLVPDDDRPVLLWDPTYGDEAVHKGWWDNVLGTFEIMEGGTDSRDIGEVTHWAELPSGPSTP